MKMLNEKECEKALNRIVDDSFNKYCDYKTQNAWGIISKLIKEHFEPQPHNFEELHEGMQVWNEDYEMCCKIDGVHIVGNNENRYSEGDKLVSISVGNCSWTELFVENRFFPISKALQYQGKEDASK